VDPNHAPDPHRPAPSVAPPDDVEPNNPVAVLAATTHWFRQRGIPHFGRPTDVEREILTRVLPFLLLVLVVEITGALNLEWSTAANVGAVAAGAALVTGAWVLVNRIRHRPALALPDRVDPVTIAFFVLAPAALPLVFGFQFRSALVTLAGNVVLLVVVWVGASYALVPMVRWALGLMVREITAVAQLLARALALLLLLLSFFFINTEAWQVASGLDGAGLALSALLFLGVGLLFIWVRLPREVGALNRFDDREEVRALVVGTPVSGHVVGAVLPPEPFTRREWGNVAMVVVVSQLAQEIVVGAAIAAFFAFFGVVTIGPEIIESWLGHDPDVIWRFDLFSREVALTMELLRVSAFLGAFAGLYFGVSSLTDATYREEFWTEVVADVRQACAVRAVYDALEGRPD
jgi:hypothetical protein